MKIYFKSVFLGLATVLLVSCTSQPGARTSSPPLPPEASPASRVDLPNRSLPSERIGYGRDFRRQTGKAALEQIKRHK